MSHIYHIGRIAQLANITLQRDKALVLVGSQGCGKSTFAEIIAAMNGFGKTLFIGDADIMSKQFNGILMAQPNVIIIDVANFDAKFIDALRPFISSTTIQVNEKYIESCDIETPFFIITTNVAPELDADDRRFTIVTL